MAGQQPSFPSEFSATQQQAMINQLGGSQMVPELMGPQQGNMSSGLVNPQQFGTGMSSNIGVAGPNPMAQQLIIQQRQQLAQQTLMQQQLQQMQQQQQEQQHRTLFPQSSQAVTQVKAPREPAPQVQMQSQERTPEHPRQPQPQQPEEEYIPTISLCETGLRTIDDITLVTRDLFNRLRIVKPPDGTQQGHATATENKKLIMNSLHRLLPNFLNDLRKVYNIFNEHCQLQDMENTHIESLILSKEERDMKFDEKKTSEVYRRACEERNELIEQLTAKNRYLKEIIDHMRLMISEINVMLHMQRT